MEEHSIPENASLLCCTSIVSNEIALDDNWNVFAWKDNNILNFCGKQMIVMILERYQYLLKILNFILGMENIRLKHVDGGE